MASYPSSAAGDAQLYVAVNNKTTTLTSGIDAVVTTIPVASTSGFPSSGFVTVDLEIIAYTSVNATNFLGATRGADGSTATSHSMNALVSHNIVAAHHNALKDETIAVEADLVAIQSALTPTAAASTATSVLNRISQIVHRFILLNTSTSNWYDVYAWLSALNDGATPGSTATSLKDRLDQIVTQIKAITGQTNWYDSVAANLTQKASTALSNLASVAINASLLPGTDNSIDLGSAAKRWVSLFAKDVDAGASGTAGTVDIYPSTATKGKIQIVAADSSGDTTTTITNASQGGARTYTVPDAGASASFVMTEGTQTINGSKTISSLILGGNQNANSNKITSLANGTAATDAAAFGQINYKTPPAQTTSTTAFSTTSSTFQTTNLSASITPSSTSARIKITITGAGRSAVATNAAFFSLFRGSTNLGSANGFVDVQGDGAGVNAPVAITYIDSPASTSSQTYSVKLRSADNASNTTFGTNGATQVMILEEII